MSAYSPMVFMLVVSTLATVFAVASGVYVAWTQAGQGLFLICVGVSAAAAVLSYISAVSASAVFATHVRVAFDLHRLELLKKLRLPVPSTPDEERRRWAEVERFFRFGEAPPWYYVDSK
jgi:hypothetical protein